jgi:hypothetical protein
LHITYFIKKDSASIRMFKFADSSCCGAGESPLFMPKQLAFYKCFRNGGAIDRNKWSPFSMAIGVDRACYQFFTGPAFSRDKHGDITFSR